MLLWLEVVFQGNLLDQFSAAVKDKKKTLLFCV